ncbi:MAG TPA: alpha/beta fold hydrolase [Anaerolineales bacterium]
MNPLPSANPVTSTTNVWFVCTQTIPEVETRLFLFPYAGSGPALFRKWSAQPLNHIEAWIAHYPGRGSRHSESPVKQITTLAERLAQAIPQLLDKPFALFGHSLGGLVAFELVKYLRNNDLPQPTILFVSACGAPHLRDPHPPIHALPDAEFIETLKEFNGIPSEFLHLPDVMELLLPVLRADLEAIESYVYTPDELPLNCPIVAFGGLNDPRVSRGRLEGWALHTDSSFKSQYFPGDHFFINTARESIMAFINAEIKALAPS